MLNFSINKRLIKWLLYGSVIVIILSIVSVSNYYNVSYLHAIKTGIRMAVLEVINAGVSIYDPFDEIKVSTGEELFNERDMAGYQQGEKKLLIILEGMPVTEANVTINSYENQHITLSKYKFGYEAFSEKRLKEINEIYNSDSRLTSSNDFNIMLEIRNRVKSLWKHGKDRGFNPGRFNTIDVIKKAEEGKRYWCHVYSLAFIQVASSAGITSRLVALSKQGYDSDHAVVEAWSNYYMKWVVMDVDYNIHYVDSESEIPLNTVELHNAFVNNDIDKVKVVKGLRRPVGYDVENSNTKLLNYYSYIYIDMRNDWYLNDYIRGHPKRSDGATLFWNDERLPEVLNLYRKVSDIESFYWTLNQTEISFKRVGDNELELYLKTVTPNFKSWLMTVDDHHKIYHNNKTYKWKFHKGYNSFTVRSINQYGVKGIKSNIAFFVE